MAPHRQIHRNQTQFRAWWKKREIFNTRIIDYFNIRVAPTQHLSSVEIITKPMLTTLFLATITATLFEVESHFISTDRYVTETSSSTGHILCQQCKVRVINPIQFTKITGGQHITLSESMVFSILEINSLWCHLCQKQLFEWYEKIECPQC